MSLLYSLEKKIAQVINLPVSEVSSYLYNWRYKRKNKEINVVIFSQTRSGSTLLENLLASTGYFKPKGEIFDLYKRQVKLPYLFLTGLSRRYGNILFHLKLDHLKYRQKPVDAKNFLKKLEKDGWHIIFLDRRNKIEQTLSYAIIKHRGNYHKTNNNKEHFEFEINYFDFKKEIKERLEERKREIEMLTNVDYIYVNYEKELKYSNNHQKTVDKILDNLSLEHRKVSSVYQKINVFKPEEIILNFEEYKKIELEFKEKL